MKKELNQNLSGNEVHYTNCLILLVENMLTAARSLAAQVMLPTCAANISAVHPDESCVF